MKAPNESCIYRKQSDKHRWRHKKITDWKYKWIGQEHNAKAIVIISSTVESSQLEYLLTCETAADVRKRLSVVHEQKSESNKLLLMTKFYNYKMAAKDNNTTKER